MPAAPSSTDQPLIGLMSAFEPEWQALVDRISGANVHSLNGQTFTVGTLEGQPVVLAMSGMSMVNAALTTQRLIDRFDVKRIVFSGIAGGIDPALNIGDVVVPARWAQSLEVIMGRETGDGFVKPDWLTWAPDNIPAYGMMIPNAVIVGSARHAPKARLWFEADPTLVSVAAGLSRIDLSRCTPDGRCLDHLPALHVGGSAVSSSAFVDNADYRNYLHRAFKAQVADMESAAVAQVAFANDVPFIVFRSVSDLAGGDPHSNEMAVFMSLAAENSAAVVCRFLKELA